MAHGGNELNLYFDGETKPVKGLEVVITQQLFPGSTFVRERITLQTAKGKPLTLGNRDEALHFSFPDYSFRVADSAGLRLNELRIATWASELLDISQSVSLDERDSKARSDVRNLAQNYMYHPRQLSHSIAGETRMDHKGPILTVVDSAAAAGIVMAYEHGSPDDDPVQNYLTLRRASQKGGLDLGVHALTGAYLNGESITDQKPYRSVWSAVGVFDGRGFNVADKMLHDYLYKWICETPYSRQPAYYYNTWGM